MQSGFSAIFDILMICFYCIIRILTQNNAFASKPTVLIILEILWILCYESWSIHEVFHYFLISENWDTVQ